MSNDWNYERTLKEVFNTCDKDGSGTLTKNDLMFALLAADKDDKSSASFKTSVRMLTAALKNADKDGDAHITFEEFKAYIADGNKQ